MPSTAAPEHELNTSRVLSHVGVMVAISVVLGLLVGGLAIPFAGALGLVSKDASQGLDDLPKSLAATQLPERTRMVTKGGKTIATFYDQNRVNVKLSEIAPIMRQAIISIEDYRFYQHGALDLKGTLRAFLTNSSGSGQTQGGSSITQQMAKLTAVQQATTPAQKKAATADTYQRKILELRHAIAFEQNYSKDWILNRYLNIAYFGDGAYGIQSAAQHYFSVDAADLTLPQAALLAGLVKSPVGLDPTTHPILAKARRDVVLDRMAELKVISNATATATKQQRLNLKLTASRNGCVSSTAPFFCDYALEYLKKDRSLGRTVEDRVQLINGGGLTIWTTLDQRYMDQAAQAIRNHVNPTDQAIGAIAMVQPGTGNVMAIAQSRPMGPDSKAGQTYLNYVIPSSIGDSAGFQAGSTFKLFVLAAALQQGISPYTTIRSPDQITVAQNSFPDCTGNYTNPAPYPVHNSTESGTMNMYEGTQQSVNTFFVQLEQRTGLCEPYDLAKKMGVELTNPTTERTPAFTLGVDNVSPVEMAGAYATVGARGIHCAAKPVTRIMNSAHQLFKKYDNECSRVLSQNTADRIADIMRGVMEPGGFGQALAFGKPSAGKTGTTNDNVAVWFDGFTPQIGTAVMVAGANQQGHPITLNGTYIGGVYTGRAHGSTVAGPIWGDAMKGIAQYLDYDDFVRPAAASSPYSSSNRFDNGFRRR